MPELAHLKKVPGYPFDLKTDFNYLAEWTLEFPMVDVVPMLRNWKLYIEKNQFKNKSNPRGQLYNQFKSASAKGIYKKQPSNGSGARDQKPDALERMEAAQKQEGQPS